MKQSDWRKVYPVPEDALDARVRAALGALSDQPVHRAGVKRALVPVLAALLVMGCACALAAGYEIITVKNALMHTARTVITAICSKPR